MSFAYFECSIRIQISIVHLGRELISSTILLTAKGKLLVFKHAIATIEAVDEPKVYKLDI
jgi:hypothetical protein